MIFKQRADRIAATVAAAFALVFLIVSFALPANSLLGASNTDMIGEFVAWRAYLAHSLSQGHIPLWNPYAYGGQPFLGGFESAVLYPPNLIFLILPLTVALNFSILFHLVILGWGMNRWATQRGLGPWAAALAGFILPLSGAVFPHIYAGHLSNISTMAWAPWIFLGIEAWVSKSDRRGLFIAAAGICLQILAGHVQYVFYTAIATGLQALVISVAVPSARWRALPTVAICYLAGAALSAAQLLPGLAATTEGVRQQKLDYSFAAMFGFPPENFLTLIAPGFFGNLGQPVYWGRCYLWEMTIFVGTASLPLIALAFLDPQRRKQVQLDITLVFMLLIIAVGHSTPLFDLLYDYAPGFGQFRSWSKFIFQATLFLVLIIATGADYLMRVKKPAPRIGWVSIGAGAVAIVTGAIFFFRPMNIHGLMLFMMRTGESYLPAEFFAQLAVIDQVATRGGLSLGLGGLILIATGAALIYLKKWPILSRAIPALIALEMVGFIAGQLTLSQYSDAAPPVIKKYIADHPGDYRIVNFAHGNNGFLLGAGDLWGNNPSVLRRYAEFMTFTQGGDPDHANQYVNFSRIDPLYALMRFQYGFVPTPQDFDVLTATIPPLPHVLLVSDWKWAPDRDGVFATMRQPGFDGSKSVVFTRKPDLLPEPGATGTAKIISENPDELVIEADTDKPTILLITDLYARDWHADPMAGSSQKSYEIMPADYILRAIPIAAGHHKIRVYYAPASFSIGIAISIAAWAIWIGLLVWFWRTKKLSP